MAQGPLLSESQLGLACLKIKILKVVPKLLNLILLDWYLGTCISIIISANTPPEDCLINRFIRWWFNLSSTLDTSLWRIAHAQAACNYTGISGGVAQASVVVKLPSDSNAQPRMRNSTQKFSKYFQISIQYKDAKPPDELIHCFNEYRNLVTCNTKGIIEQLAPTIPANSVIPNASTPTKQALMKVQNCCLQGPTEVGLPVCLEELEILVISIWPLLAVYKARIFTRKNFNGFSS